MEIRKELQIEQAGMLGRGHREIQHRLRKRRGESAGTARLEIRDQEAQANVHMAHVGGLSMKSWELISRLPSTVDEIYEFFTPSGCGAAAFKSASETAVGVAAAFPAVPCGQAYAPSLHRSDQWRPRQIPQRPKVL